MNEREYKAEIEALKQRIAELEKTEIELPPPPHPRWMPMNDEKYWLLDSEPVSMTWNNDICDANWYEFGNVFIVPEIVTNGEFTRGEMRFATREDAENCIRAVGADRIIKYYFEISQEEKK